MFKTARTWPFLVLVGLFIVKVSFNTPAAAWTTTQSCTSGPLSPKCPLFDSLRHCVNGHRGSCQTDYSLKMLGLGIVPAEKLNPNTLVNKNIAISQARANILNAVEDLAVDSDLKVLDSYALNDRFKTNLRLLLKDPGMPAEEKSDASGNFFALVGFDLLPIYAQYYNYANLPFSRAVPPANLPANPALPSFSSLILNANAFPLKPALYPKILNSQGAPLFNQFSLPKEYILSRGFVHYALSLTEAQNDPFTGPNPVILRAKGITGKYPVDLVLGDREALLFQRLQKEQSFINQGKIIILLGSIP